MSCIGLAVLKLTGETIGVPCSKFAASERSAARRSRSLSAGVSVGTAGATFTFSTNDEGNRTVVSSRNFVHIERPFIWEKFAARIAAANVWPLCPDCGCFFKSFGEMAANVFGVRGILKNQVSPFRNGSPRFAWSASSADAQTPFMVGFIFLLFIGEF